VITGLFVAVVLLLASARDDHRKRTANRDTRKEQP